MISFQVIIYVDSDKFKCSEVKKYIKFLVGSKMLKYDGHGATIGEEYNEEHYFYYSKDETDFNYLFKYKLPSFIAVNISYINK